MDIRFFPIILSFGGCGFGGRTNNVEQTKIEVTPIEAFQKSQYHLDNYPSKPGQEAVLAADHIESNDSFWALGLAYEVTLDLDGASAEEYLYWCKLSQIGGGNAIPYVIPVDIASSIVDNTVYFDYPFKGSHSFILSCEFDRLEAGQSRIGFTAALSKILGPRAASEGDLTIIYGGTNRSKVMRTAYLVEPHND